MSELSE